VTNAGGPRFSRKRVGEEIRRLRTEAMLSQGQLGTLVRASGARISRLETGGTAPDVALVMNILEVLQVDEELTHTLILIAREANEQTWWKASGMPDPQQAVAELEGASTKAQAFTSAVIPGLLQSPSYISVRYADRKASLAIDINAATVGRLERQKVLTRHVNPLEFTAVFEELVVRRRTAPEDVMREQRRHLVEMASLPNIELRILPTDAELGSFTPPLTSFTLYNVRNAQQVAGVETDGEQLQITEARRVERYQLLFDRIIGGAMSSEESIAFIEGVGT
jgi:transcriptional regulator with XRE-family HTH domain